MIFKPNLRDSWELLSLVISRTKDWAWVLSPQQRAKRPLSLGRLLQRPVYWLWRGTGHSRSKIHWFWDIPAFPCDNPNTTPLQMAVFVICMTSSDPSEIVSTACDCTATLRTPYAFYLQPGVSAFVWPENSFILVTESSIRAKSEFGEIKGKCQQPLLWKIHFKDLSGDLIYWKLKTGLSIGIFQGTSAYLPHMCSQIYLLLEIQGIFAQREELYILVRYGIFLSPARHQTMGSREMMD